MKSTLSRAAKGVLVVSGVGLGVWFCLILTDLLTFYWVYSASHNVLENYGMSEYAAKIAGVLFAAFIMLVAHGALWSMIKRDLKRWIPMVTSGILIWLVIMYAVSSPYAGSPINPFNRQAQKYYRDQFGTMYTIGRGALVGPHGEPVQFFDKATAQEYERQQKAKEKKVSLNSDSDDKGGQGFLSSLFSQPSNGLEVVKSGDSTHLSMWAEKIEIAPELTVLHIAVKSTGDDKYGWLYASDDPSANYLVDENGQTYDFVGEQHTTPGKSFFIPAPSFFNWITDRGMNIRPQEVYHYTATFRPFASGVKHLMYHSRQFPDLHLDKLLATTKHVPISSITLKEREVEAERAKQAAKEATRLEVERAAQAEAEKRVSTTAKATEGTAVEVVKGIALQPKVQTAEPGRDSEEAQILFNDGVSHWNFGNKQAAIKPLEEYLKIAPNGQNAGTARSLLKLIPIAVETAAEAKVQAAEKALAKAEAKVLNATSRLFFLDIPQLRRDPNSNRRGSYGLGPDPRAYKVRLEKAEAEAEVEAAKRALAEAKDELARLKTSPRGPGTNSP